MELIKLILIFICIMAIIKLRKPLYAAIAAGAVCTVLLYGIDPLTVLRLTVKGSVSRDTIYLVLAFYTITYLQRMMESRGHLIMAEEALSRLFNSRRINAMLAPFLIGILPSAGAVLIAAPIVDNAAENYLTKEEKTFVTSYFRHIPEIFLPTYSSILLALSLSGVDMTIFVLGMIPMVIVLFYLGYFFYVRKIPKGTGKEESKETVQEIRNLVTGLWPILLSIILILAFKIPVHLGVLPVIALSIIVNRFSLKELKPMIVSALETKLILTTIVIMVFKEMITYAGIIESLPGYFSALPVPSAIIFAMIFFFSTLVAGSQTTIALAMPLAYATIPNGGAALLILLMCMLYISMQVAPTHICLGIIVEHNGTSFMDLVKNTMPVLLVFVLISSIYSYLLFQFL